MKKPYIIVTVIVAIITFTSIFYFMYWRSTNINMNISETQRKQYGFYKNPIAKQGDFADPFILKYNGRYYLYCTNPDVKCWSSTDLLQWKYEGTVIAPGQLVGLVPFAPEVVYWNGCFYMYTSPSGLGHYILKSESPTGPFVLQTENIGLMIDGSVFIDDDGKWYFYRADDYGIKGYTMKDPVTIDEEVSINAFMDGWTEGPYIVKRNGRYFMTYTGNHFLSNGYRINYAVSSESPLTGFKPYEKNPLLINTEGEGVGLGHSMSFLGPDLDTWFITYHNLNLDATRDLNIDRLAWNGEKMVVYGPTVSKQTAPDLPDLYDYFDRNEPGDNWIVKSGSFSLQNSFATIKASDDGKAGIILSKGLCAKDYTAEFNMKLKDAAGKNDGRFGAVVSYMDDSNYVLILLNTSKNTVESQIIVDGKIKKIEAVLLPQGYDYSKLHCIRVEKSGGIFKVYVDGMMKQTIAANGFQEGNIGFYSESTAAFGYTAVSNRVNGESVYSAYKPVPGNIEAVHFNMGGEDVGYCLKAESGDSELRSDGFFTEASSEGGFNTALRKKGEWLAYNVNVAETTAFNMDLRAADIETGSRLNIWLDDDLAMESLELDSSTVGEWRTLPIKGINLQEGMHTLRLELVKGALKLSSMNFYKANGHVSDFKDDFGSALKDWAYITGLGQEYICKDGMLQLGPYGKLAAGESGWTDYTVEVDIKGDSGFNSGIIFRVTNPAEGGEGADCMLGSNFYQGYFAGLTRDGVILAKQNYDKKELAKSLGSYEPGRTYHMKVNVEGDNIKIFVDDMDKAIIDFTDKDPFTHGKAGIRTEGEIAFFDNFIVAGK